MHRSRIMMTRYLQSSISFMPVSHTGKTAHITRLLCATDTAANVFCCKVVDTARRNSSRQRARWSSPQGSKGSTLTACGSTMAFAVCRWYTQLQHFDREAGWGGSVSPLPASSLHLRECILAGRPIVQRLCNVRVELLLLSAELCPPFTGQPFST